MRADIAAATGRLIPEDEATPALAAFDPVWEAADAARAGAGGRAAGGAVDYDGGTGRWRSPSTRPGSRPWRTNWPINVTERHHDEATDHGDSIKALETRSEGHGARTGT